MGGARGRGLGRWGHNTTQHTTTHLPCPCCCLGFCFAFMTMMMMQPAAGLSAGHSRRLGNANELAPDAMDLIGTAPLWSLSSQPLRI